MNATMEKIEHAADLIAEELQTAANDEGLDIQAELERIDFHAKAQELLGLSIEEAGKVEAQLRAATEKALA